MVFSQKVLSKVLLIPAYFFRWLSSCHLYRQQLFDFGPLASQVQAVIASLQQTFLLKNEGEVKDFLGICISRDPQDGTITLTQLSLIDLVLTDLGLLSDESMLVKHKFTPVSSILHLDPDGLPSSIEGGHSRSLDWVRVFFFSLKPKKMLYWQLQWPFHTTIPDSRKFILVQDLQVFSVMVVNYSHTNKIEVLQCLLSVWEVKINSLQDYKTVSGHI